MNGFYRDLCHCSKWLLYVNFMHIARFNMRCRQKSKNDLLLWTNAGVMEKSVTLIYTAALSVTEWKIFQKHHNKQTNKQTRKHWIIIFLWLKYHFYYIHRIKCVSCTFKMDLYCQRWRKKTHNEICTNDIYGRQKKRE